jgi:hypothetical protein
VDTSTPVRKGCPHMQMERNRKRTRAGHPPAAWLWDALRQVRPAAVDRWCDSLLAWRCGRWTRCPPGSPAAAAPADPPALRATPTRDAGMLEAGYVSTARACSGYPRAGSACLVVKVSTYPPESGERPLLATLCASTGRLGYATHTQTPSYELHTQPPHQPSRKSPPQPALRPLGSNAAGRGAHR